MTFNILFDLQKIMAMKYRALLKWFEISKFSIAKIHLKFEVYVLFERSQAYLALHPPSLNKIITAAEISLRPTTLQINLCL